MTDKYTIATGSSEEVTKKVNELIAEGWRPYGSISVIITANSWREYAQPMVRDT